MVDGDEWRSWDPLAGSPLPDGEPNGEDADGVVDLGLGDDRPQHGTQHGTSPVVTMIESVDRYFVEDAGERFVVSRQESFAEGLEFWVVTPVFPAFADEGRKKRVVRSLRSYLGARG